MRINELHDRLYEMLKIVDGICKNHHIQYWMHGGSAIGAVREHDFIPWDDDMDILILAEDYPRFCEAMKYLPEHYHLIEPYDFSPFFYDYVIRICDDRWRLRPETKEDKVYRNYQNSVCIDVFLLSYCPEKGLKQKTWFLKYDILYGMAMKYRHSIDYSKYSFTQICQVATLRVLGGLFSKNDPNRIIRKWEQFALSSDATRTRMVSNTLIHCYWQPMPDAWFKDTVYVKFRDMEVPVQKEYDKVLSLTFGNYMVPERDTNKYLTHLNKEDLLPEDMERIL